MKPVSEAELEGTGNPRPAASGRPAHVLCRSSFWAASSVIACAYLAFVSFSRIRNSLYSWPADIWDISAYVIWIVFMLIILADIRCKRERLFFSVVLANFVVGMLMAAWTNAPPGGVQVSRYLSFGLWILGLLIGVWILFSPARDRDAVVQQKSEHHA